MEKLLEYMKYYINLYNENSNDTEKLNIFKSIEVIYKVASCYMSNSKTYFEIRNIYCNFILGKDNMFNELENYFEELNNIRLFKDDDIKYIFELLNIINKNDLNYNYYKDNFNNENLFNYINGNKDYVSLINYIKDKTIKDKRFYCSCQLCLYKDILILLNNDSIIDYIHELTHIYTRNINNGFIETPSILAELGLSSFYKLGDKYNRINELNKYNNRHLNMILSNKIDFQKDLEYMLGTIISLGFIYNNGNNFDVIKQAVDIISYNSNKSVTQIMNILNIKENDIVNSFKKKELILGKNEAYFR